MAQLQGPTEKAPRKFQGGSCTIIGNTAYFNPLDSQDIYAFKFKTRNAENRKWSTLPPCPYKKCTLTSIKDWLTTVGGENTQTPAARFEPQSKLWTFSSRGRTTEWKNSVYPEMPSGRYYSAVVSTKTHLIVIGGRGEVNHYLNEVVVMNIKTKIWSTTASHLPHGVNRASAVLCGKQLYVVADNISNGGSNIRVVFCDIDELIDTSQRCTSLQVWRSHTVSDPPVSYPACVTFRDKVFIIGGTDKKSHRLFNVIYKYNPPKKCNAEISSQWVEVGQMAMARADCLATALADSNQLLIVGGYNGDHTWRDGTDETEIVTLVI